MLYQSSASHVPCVKEASEEQVKKKARFWDPPSGFQSVAQGGPRHPHCKTHLRDSEAGRIQAKPGGNSELIAATRFPPELKMKEIKLFLELLHNSWISWWIKSKKQTQWEWDRMTPKHSMTVILWYNKQYMFGLHPSSWKAPKCLVFPQWYGSESVFCYL